MDKNQYRNPKAHSIRDTELIINYLNEHPYKFGIKIWLLADMNNQCVLPSVKPVTKVGTIGK